ncbi:MAG: dUTP diphosphatase [archaeon]
MVIIKIKKVKDVKTPEYAHLGDSGVDLHSAEKYELKPMDRVLVSTGIKIAIPIGYEGQVRPKSGLAIKQGLSVVNTPGTIDAGYRGEVKVIVINLGNETALIDEGQKIAQLVITRVEQAQFEEVSELDDTSRQEGGFGSTGLR